MRDGWHENTGSEYPPVPEGTLIDVVYRSGGTIMCVGAGCYGATRWYFNGSNWDIMLWRLHEKKEETINPSNQEEQAMIEDNTNKVQNVTTRGGVHESLRSLDDNLFALSNVLEQVEDALVPVLGPVLPSPPASVVPGPSNPTPAKPGDSSLAQRIQEQAVRTRSLTLRLREILDRVDL